MRYFGPTRPMTYFADWGAPPVGGCVLRVNESRSAPAGWLSFTRPTTVLCANSIGEVLGVIESAEQSALDGRAVVGLVSYEAGSAFEPALPTGVLSEAPYAWFGVYDEPPRFARELWPTGPVEPSSPPDSDWNLDEYREPFHQVHEWIRSGRTYQVNLTQRLRYRFDRSPYELFTSRCGVDPPPYAAYMNGGPWTIVCLSPECFLERQGRRVTMRPMKGTDRPESGVHSLPNSPKDRAENLMIVDMVRNDLSRVARLGSVVTSPLIALEEHRTVLQLTSSVHANVDGSTIELISSTFPPASVTGAPKIESCKIIADTEASPRGVYCGAIGVLGPGRVASFGVAIRTGTFRRDQKELSYGVGGGVVWDSSAEGEYAEMMLKTEVMTKPAPEWGLVEAIATSADTDTMERHWARLARSAHELGVPLSLDVLRATVLAARQTAGSLPKIRVVLRADGRIEASAESSRLSGTRLTAALARRPIPDGDPNIRHKTTSRQVFDSRRAARTDLTLHYNRRGEVTEFCVGAFLALLDGEWVSPPESVGRLPSVSAAKLVESGAVKLRLVAISDLARCEKIEIVNAVAGRVPVDLTTPARAPRAMLF